MNPNIQTSHPVANEDVSTGMQSVDMVAEEGMSICLERTGEILRIVKIDGDRITFEKID